MSDPIRALGIICITAVLLQGMASCDKNVETRMKMVENVLKEAVKYNPNPKDIEAFAKELEKW